MTPIEKAENALNSRIERIQTTLAATSSDATRQFLTQALVVSIGIGEALAGYVKMIGQYAQSRHRELKPAHDALAAQHADLLRSGTELLERLKANPTDRTIRKEIEAAQKNMARIQKTLRRGANALQRDLTPSMAMIDVLATTVRRLADADQIDELKRAVKLMLGHARDLYLAHSPRPAKNIVDAAAWETLALAEIDRATDSNEAYTRAGFQALLALDMMTMAVSPTPPNTAEEATRRAAESVGDRLKAITARFARPIGQP